MTAKEKRLAQLMESWRVLVGERDQALRWRDRSRLGGLATALRLIDACIAIEESALAERDDYGNIISDPDQSVSARLREIARTRNIFGDIPMPAATVSTPAAEASAEPPPSEPPA